MIQYDSDSPLQVCVDPLVDKDVDLRNFAFFPLDAGRLRDSKFAFTVGAESFRCAILLWCAAWHQLPAASLPDDDVQLSQLAGFGRAVTEWQKCRDEALYGWIRCCDGRLYHPVLAEKANDAWESKLRQRWQTECARIRKHNQRNKTDHPEKEFEEWKAGGCLAGVPLDKQSLSQGQIQDASDLSQGRPTALPCEVASNRTDTDTDTDTDKETEFKANEPSKRRCLIPEDWKPDERDIAYARSKGINEADIAIEAERFLNHWLAKGEPRANWSAGWKSWILKSIEFRKTGKSAPPKPTGSHLERNMFVGDDF